MSTLLLQFIKLFLYTIDTRKILIHQAINDHICSRKRSTSPSFFALRLLAQLIPDFVNLFQGLMMKRDDIFIADK
ncbi:hypothetical protein D3C76_839490 [compost metagenome]